MTEEEARQEAQSWVENGGHVRECDSGFGGVEHLHLYDDKKSEDFVLTYEKGSGYEDDEDHSDTSSNSDDSSDINR